MVVAARADCFPFAVQDGLRLAELKERILHGLEEEVTAALAQPAVQAAEASQKTCIEASAGDEDALSARLLTCQVLAEEAMCGEAQAAVSVAEMLSDAASEVRQAALEALTCIVDFAPRGVVDATAASLALSDAGLRWRSQEHSIVAAAIAARVGA